MTCKEKGVKVRIRYSNWSCEIVLRCHTFFSSFSPGRSGAPIRSNVWWPHRYSGNVFKSNGKIFKSIWLPTAFFLLRLFAAHSATLIYSRRKYSIYRRQWVYKTVFVSMKNALVQLFSFYCYVCICVDLAELESWSLAACFNLNVTFICWLFRLWAYRSIVLWVLYRKSFEVNSIKWRVCPLIQFKVEVVTETLIHGVSRIQITLSILNWFYCKYIIR